MWTIAKYELLRMLRAKTVLAILLIAPVVLIFILGAALQDLFQMKDSEIDPLTLAIYDADQEEIAQGFQRFLQGNEVNSWLIPLQVQSREEIIEKVKSEEAHLGVVIPQGFTQRVTSGREASWEIITGKDRIKNLRGQMILDSFLDEVNRIQATIITLGPGAVEGIREVSMTEQLEQTESSNTSYVQLGRLAADKDYSAMQYYASTMMIMFLLYAGLTAAISLLQEKENHTLSRLHSIPFSPTNILLGKIIGNGLLACLQAAVLISVTMFVLDVDWGDSWLYLCLICILTIFASMNLALIVSFLFHSTKVLGGAFGTFIGVMTFMSGGMSPNEGTFLENFKPFTLNYWAADGIHHLMLGSSATLIQQHLWILFCLGCLFMLIAFGLYRKVGYHE